MPECRWRTCRSRLRKAPDRRCFSGRRGLTLCPSPGGEGREALLPPGEGWGMREGLDALRKVVKPYRVVDQHALAQRVVGNPFRYHVGEGAIVGHELGVRMRPVGAPHATVRRCGDQRLRERGYVRELRRLF